MAERILDPPFFLASVVFEEALLHMIKLFVSSGLKDGTYVHSAVGQLDSLQGCVW